MNQDLTTTEGITNVLMNVINHDKETEEKEKYVDALLALMEYVTKHPTGVRIVYHSVNAIGAEVKSNGVVAIPFRFERTILSCVINAIDYIETVTVDCFKRSDAINLTDGILYSLKFLLGEEGKEDITVGLRNTIGSDGAFEANGKYEAAILLSNLNQLLLL